MLGTRTTVVVAAVVAATGAVATALDGVWDLFVLFVVLTVAQVLLLVLFFGPRRLVTVRSDLGRWLDMRATLTGEPVARLTDRSIASVRAGLLPADD